MNINTESLISIADATQNFSKVAKLVDEKGSVVIHKNNHPHYILMDYKLLQKNIVANDDELEIVASRILKKYHKAFEELAK